MHRSAPRAFDWRPVALIVLASAVLGLLGGAVGLLLPIRYEATATAQVGLLTGNTEAVRERLATAYAAAARAQRPIGSERVTADAGAAAGVLHVTVDADGAAGAAAAANGLVQRLGEAVPAAARPVVGSGAAVVRLVRPAPMPDGPSGIGAGGAALIGVLVGAVGALIPVAIRARRADLRIAAAHRRSEDDASVGRPVPVPVRIAAPEGARRS